MNRTPRAEDVRVGWIAALDIELAAARAMLDEEYGTHRAALLLYTLGRVGEHAVVIACLPAGQIGLATGASIATEMQAKFPALEFFLLVGVGGGIPSAEADVRLGDVVVSQPHGSYGGVVQYDLGKTGPGGLVTRTGFLNAPSALLLRAVSQIKANRALGKDSMPEHLSRLEGTRFSRGKSLSDNLFHSSYRHVEGPTCENCSRDMLVPRPSRRPECAIHYGTIASGNQVMKDAMTRDRISAELGGGILCFEMEAAGLMNRLPSLVIRGIADYADSHKNSEWQPYATATAAAYAKQLLGVIPPFEHTEHRDEILNWIASPQHEQKHTSIAQHRVEGSGRWLLEHPSYTTWRDDATTSPILWCDGVQGSGKTVLTSVAPDQNQQTVEDIILSLLRQIVETLPSIPKALTDAYRRHGGSKCSLPRPTLEGLLLNTVHHVTRLYIVIDGVDECMQRGRRTDLLRLLRNTTLKEGVRIFLTSRPHVREIHSTFHTIHRILVRAHKDDMTAYVSREIREADAYDIIDKRFARRITKEIVRRAQGMFLLPVLHTRTVLCQPTAGDMEDSLESISCDLSDAFQTTIDRISRLPASHRSLAISALMFISHARRPLTIPELTDILSVELGQTEVRPRHRPLPRVVLECCQGLVNVDPKTLRVRLTHYSFQEYLVEHSARLFDGAEAGISALCVTYLLLPPFKHGPQPNKDEIIRLIETFPFVRYAAKYWGEHVQSCEDNPVVWNLAVEFLGDRHAIACANQVQQFAKNYKDIYWRPKECYSETALHISSHFGLQRMVSTLLHQNVFPVDSATKMGTTPIIKAAARGHEAIVKELLKRGANPYLENWYGNALHCAAEAGHSNTIHVLVNHGMTPNASGMYARVPVHCTIDQDRVSAFETLVRSGADVDIVDEDGFPLLFRAAGQGSLQIVDLILRQELVDINCRAGDGDTALHYAAELNDTVILGKLIDAGADIHATDKNGLKPVDYATLADSQDTARLLDTYMHKTG
ncbi:hypothetical protein FE257_007891 [Aspergillus nanangensis]|uniref:NACHT domain-containing protein n=1 Tax=Aspergillus nanangensis TaxID=2582783 RepID=A0AAD4H065_ASPNN|nr:hypothetical protein FE257_007891 [Aspergillus nanangensis]